MAPAAGRLKLREAIDPHLLRQMAGPGGSSLGYQWSRTASPAILAPVLLTSRPSPPVIPVTIKRSTLRGTALIVLEVLAPDLARRASATGEFHNPSPMELPRTGLASRTTRPCTRQRSRRPERSPSRALLVVPARRCGRRLLANDCGVRATMTECRCECRATPGSDRRSVQIGRGSDRLGREHHRLDG